jgi:hypothetical protein
MSRIIVGSSTRPLERQVRMFKKRMPTGFYFTAFDLFILIGGAISSVVIGQMWAWQFGVFAAVAVLHFFLFCNIIRIWRPYELIWAGLFVLNIYLWMQFDMPRALGVCAILLIQMCFTSAFLALQMRSKYYHGVGWQQLNPGYKIPHSE